MLLIALKDLWRVADNTGIISKILMILDTALYKSRFVACRMSSSLYGLLSTKAHLIF